MISVQQAAEKWNISQRTAQYWCRSGKIPGAELHGRVWFIPDDAEKPADMRTKASKQNAYSAPALIMPKQTPILIMSDLYSVPGSAEQCIKDLSDWPEVATLFEAWLLYAQGDVHKAVGLAKPLLEVSADFYGTISVGTVLCACALWIGDMALFRRGRSHIESVKCENENDTEILDFWLAVTDKTVLDQTQYLDWLIRGNFERLPADSLPAAWFYYARHQHRTARALARGEIELADMNGLGLYRAYPYIAEPLVTQAQRSGSVFAELCIRILCADAYFSVGDRENTIRHLDSAIKLAIPDRLYGVLAEFRGLFNNLMDERLLLLDKDAVKAVEALYRKMMLMWTKMTDREVSELLTQREHEIAQLATLGMSNSQIAENLHISINTVKSAITSIMNKTGAQKRSEFSQYIF